MLVVKANALIRFKPITCDVPPVFHSRQSENNRERVKNGQLLLVLKETKYKKNSCASKTEVMVEDKVGYVYLFENEVEVL